MNGEMYIEKKSINQMIYSHIFFSEKLPQEDKRIKTLFSFLFFFHTTEKNGKRIRFFRPLGYEYDHFLNV